MFVTGPYISTEGTCPVSLEVHGVVCQRLYGYQCKGDQLVVMGLVGTDYHAVVDGWWMATRVWMTIRNGSPGIWPHSG